MMFSLDKLKVYDKALASAASLARYSRSWGKRHAVTDQLLRASESVVLNLRLEFMRWFHGLPGAPKLSTRQLRQVDKLPKPTGVMRLERGGTCSI